MSTLVLNLVGPQSWGISSHFKRRETGSEPSKSGVFGLIEAAMGLDRGETYPSLDKLYFGVRVDRPGQLEVDFQTAESVAMAKGSGHKNEILQKFYLADAHFMVALEGDRAVLETIQEALLSPRRPVYLGRRAFSPICPIILPDSLQQAPLEAVLATYPWCASHIFSWNFRSVGESLRVVIDDANGYEVRHDVRLGPPARHEFTQRRVRTYLVEPVIASVEEVAGIQLSEVESKPEPLLKPVDSEKVLPRQIIPTEPQEAPTAIYESQLVFKNPAFNPADMYQYHNLVLRALGVKGSRRKIPVLFRLDEWARDSFKLVVRSSQQADWSQIDLFDIVDFVSGPFQQPNISIGDRFKFGIRVNPTKKRLGKKFGLDDPEQQITWFGRKADQRGGFHILEITRHSQERLLVSKGRRRLLFTGAVFEGVGEVVDIDLFEKCLWYGLAASGKFAGFNMLLILEYPI